MRIPTFIALTLVCLSLLTASAGFAVTPAEVPNPRSDNRWVSDTAQILDAGQEAEIERLIDIAHSRLGVEIAVVTVDEVDSATPKDFATELFNYWGIGKRNANNGLLVLMVMGQRRLEMETGYGTEAVLTDGWLKRMQEAEMVPRFKRGEFGEGLRVGVQKSVDRLLTAAEHGSLPEGGGTYDAYDDDGSDSSLPWWLALLGGAGVAGGGGAGVAWKRRRDRACPQCKKQMEMLSEEEDDQHLDAGQQAEERLGSVDWQYYFCRECQTNKLIPRNKWFSGFAACDSCRHRTMSSTTHTISSPTQYSTGLAEETRDCRHCSYHRTFTRILPRLPPPSSSSSSGGSSGGSSFGGGSSGGGGAGSSW